MTLSTWTYLYQYFLQSSVALRDAWYDIGEMLPVSVKNNSSGEEDTVQLVSKRPSQGLESSLCSWIARQRLA